MMTSKPTPFWSPVWKSMVLSSVLLVHIIPLYANGSSFISNSTHTNSSELKGVGHKIALPGKATPISLGQVHSRKPRSGEESGSGGESGTTPSVGSSGREHLMDLTGGGMAAKLPAMAESQIRLDFNEEVIEDSAPRWKSERLQADGTLLNLKQTEEVTDLFSYETTPSQPEEIITVNFYNPPPHHHVGDDPPAWVQELQGGDPTSWTLSDFYDYLSPDLSPTDIYPDESQPTPLDMEDENGPGSDQAGSPTNSDCLFGFLRINETCVSPCEVYTSYCFNGGQCFVVDGIGAFCRCNVQEFIWNKGSRCESAITDFQVLCIAVGGTAIMFLVLFMVIVFFSKKLYLLRNENKRLRKRSKCRPPSEQPVDNFSLSTVAENSQANVRKLCEFPTNFPHARALAYYDNIVCQKTMSRYTWEYKPKEDCGCEDDPAKEEPVKCPPEEDELLNNQNSLTPKLENNKAASEDNAEEGGVTIDLELLLPKEAKMHSETSPPLHYNVFLYKLPKSPKKSPVMRRPPGRSGQGRPLSQLCPRRSSEPGYSPISTRSLPGVLSGSSSPRPAYTP